MPSWTRSKTGTNFWFLNGGKRPKRISKPEHRGILNYQLLKLIDFINRQAVEGVIASWADEYGYHGEVAKANLYVVTKHIINPFTEDYRCSYVEAVTDEPKLQKPHVFVSHWWGFPVASFQKCITRHMVIRGWPQETAYWVCAYANNQHDLGQELGSDPMQSSFLKAMQVADAVLLILDAKATPFSRVWCCFEEGIVALAARKLLKSESRTERKALNEISCRDGQDGRLPSLLLDVAAMDEQGNARLLLQGLTDAERKQEEIHKLDSNKPSGWDMKSDRERHFPLAVVRESLGIDILKARASRDLDKKRILNALASRPMKELDDEPFKMHRNYDIIDQSLRANFALTALRPAAEQSAEAARQDLLLMASAIQEDYTRTAMELHFGKTTPSENLVIILGAIPPLTGLKQLTILCQGCGGVTDEVAAEIGKSLKSLVALETLTLDLSRCQGLASAAGLAEGLPGLKSLITLRMNLRFTRLDTVRHLGASLARLKALQSVNLNFRSTYLSEFPLAAEGRGVMPCLEVLRLEFRHCKDLRTLGTMGSAIASMSRLKLLQLDFSGCKLLRDHGGLDWGLQLLSELEVLDMIFSNSYVSDLGSLGRALPYLTKLKTLSLEAQFHKSGNCPLVGLTQGLRSLVRLEKLTLNFTGSDSVRSLHQLGECLSTLLSLRCLSLEFSTCRRLSHVAEIGTGLALLQSVKEVNLSFRFTHLQPFEALSLAAGLVELPVLEVFLLNLGGCSSLPQTLCTRHERINELRRLLAFDQLPHGWTAPL